MVHMVQKRNNVGLDLVDLLLKSEGHIRGIAKRMGESHSTILRNLNTLKEADVVDFRRDGKNKIFFLKRNLVSRNYILQAELHKLTKLLGEHLKFNIIFDEILQKTDNELIILFGSYAKGLEKKNSDIDIYIETKSRNIKKTIESVNSKINVKIGTFDLNSPLIKEIIKNHIIIRGFEGFYDKQIFR